MMNKYDNIEAHKFNEIFLMSKTMKKSKDDFDENEGKDELKSVREKVFNRTVKVIKHFDLNYKLIEHLHDCLVRRDTLFDDKFTFKFARSSKGKELPTSVMTLIKTKNPFSFIFGGNRNIHDCKFEIHFDSKQNISHIVFALMYFVNYSKFDRGVIRLIYDAKFKFIGRELEEHVYNQTTRKNISTSLKKNKDMVCSEEEELFLMGLYFNKNNEMLTETVPEINIESAYNFNSDEFKDRLCLVNMFLM